MGRQTTPLTFRTEAETADFAKRLAPLLAAGDCLLLEGQIGAGKSFFARQIIRALTHPDEEVPSPTFTLVQTYPAPDFDIWHCDLYRLGHADELVELGLEEALDSALVLIEWPDRLGGDQPEAALTLAFSAPAEGVRQVRPRATHPRWQPVLRLFDDR